MSECVHCNLHYKERKGKTRNRTEKACLSFTRDQINPFSGFTLTKKHRKHFKLILFLDKAVMFGIFGFAGNEELRTWDLFLKLNILNLLDLYIDNFACINVRDIRCLDKETFQLIVQINKETYLLFQTYYVTSMCIYTDYCTQLNSVPNHQLALHIMSSDHHKTHKPTEQNGFINSTKKHNWSFNKTASPVATN